MKYSVCNAWYFVISPLASVSTEESNVVMYTVIIEIDNSSRKLLPGMTASVTIKAQEAKDVLSIPAMALQYKPSAKVKEQINIKKIDNVSENQEVVYVFEKDNIVPRVITKGITDMTNVEIKEGLSLNEKVIIEAKEPRGAHAR